MEIRSYKPEDFDSLKELLEVTKLFDESYDKKEKFDNKTPEGSAIVATEDKKIIGFVLFTWDRWDSSIYRLAVHPDYQKKGIGEQLLKEAENRLKGLGADVVQLGFDSKNKKNEEFFRKKGYSGNWGPYTWVEKRLD